MLAPEMLGRPSRSPNRLRSAAWPERPRSARRKPGLAVLALASALPATAAAAPSDLAASLSWVRSPGAESCIDAAELALAVEADLGRSIFVTPSQARLFVEGLVEPSGAGYRATVRVMSRDGELRGTRVLQSSSSSCRSLDEDLATVLGLLIDPEARPVSSTPPPPPEPAWRPLTGLRVGLSTGLAPGLSGEGVLTFGAVFARRYRAHLQLGASALHREERAGVALEVRQWVGALDACGTIVTASPVAFDLCALGTLQRLEARERGADWVALPEVAAGAGIDGRLALGRRFDLLLGATVQATVLRAELTRRRADATTLELVDDRLWASAPVAGGAHGGLELAW